MSQLCSPSVPTSGASQTYSRLRQKIVGQLIYEAPAFLFRMISNLHLGGYGYWIFHAASQRWRERKPKATASRDEWQNFIAPVAADCGRRKSRHTPNQRARPHIAGAFSKHWNSRA